MTGKSKSKPKARRRVKQRSFISKKGRAFETKLNEIVSKEIVKFRKMPREHWKSFLSGFLPKEKTEALSDTSLESISQAGNSIIFTPENEQQEKPKEVAKEAESGDEESNESEATEDTPDEVDESEGESSENTNKPEEVTKSTAKSKEPAITTTPTGNNEQLGKKSNKNTTGAVSQKSPNETTKLAPKMKEKTKTGKNK